MRLTLGRLRFWGSKNKFTGKLAVKLIEIIEARCSFKHIFILNQSCDKSHYILISLEFSKHFVWSFVGLFLHSLTIRCHVFYIDCWKRDCSSQELLFLVKTILWNSRNPLTLIFDLSYLSLWMLDAFGRDSTTTEPRLLHRQLLKKLPLLRKCCAEIIKFMTKRISSSLECRKWTNYCRIAGGWPFFSSFFSKTSHRRLILIKRVILYVSRVYVEEGDKESPWLLCQPC